MQRPRRTDPCSQMMARDGPCGSKAFGTHSQPSLIAPAIIASCSSIYLMVAGSITSLYTNCDPATFLASIDWIGLRGCSILQRPRRTDPCSQMTARDGPCSSKAFGTHSQPSLIAPTIIASCSSIYLTVLLPGLVCEVAVYCSDQEGPILVVK